MTEPVPPPADPLVIGRYHTPEEFAALPADAAFRYELQEGSVVVTPNPGPAHAAVVLELGIQLSPQLPVELDILPGIDVHLDALPATVRVPDLALVTPDALDRQGHLVPASDIVVAIEILSHSSVRTDTVVKTKEYADAGIPHCWLIHPTRPITATVLRLSGDRYIETVRADGVFMVEEPCPLWIDLTALPLTPA